MARISKASPQLFLSCATGVHIKRRHAEREPCRRQGKGDFLKYKLSDVLVTSVQHGDGEDDVPTEQFSLSYAASRSRSRPRARAAAAPPVTAGFDLKLNKKI